MSNKNAPKPLTKHHSWSPDANREQAWRRKKTKRPLNHLNRSGSVTDDDLEELKGCIDLGFRFVPDSPDFNRKLSETLPALELYSAVHRQYTNHLSRTSSLTSESDVSTPPIIEQVEELNRLMIVIGDDEETTKQKLKQWAQVVGISVRQLSGESN